MKVYTVEKRPIPGDDPNPTHRMVGGSYTKSGLYQSVAGARAGVKHRVGWRYRMAGIKDEDHGVVVEYDLVPTGTIIDVKV